MSKKQLSAYQNSCFDAVESTRRLSEEITDASSFIAKDKPHSESTHFSRNLKQKLTNGTNLDVENGIDIGRENYIDNKENENGDNQDTGKTSNNEPHQITTEYHGKSNNTQFDVSSPVGTNKNMFDQRSVSDSDLDSPDDFSDRAFSDRDDGERADGEAITSLYHEMDQKNRNALEANESGINTNPLTMKENINQRNESSEPNDSTSSSKVPGSKDNDCSKDLHDKAATTKDQELDPCGDTKHGKLTAEEIDKKLNDVDVVRQGELLDTVRAVGLTNLTRLQQLDRNDPVIRRLFLKPRVMTSEINSIKVDPDIKNMVNEFLKTNVTENFVISRVLRENYATFYSWLACHLQSERNAWATRLAQALEQADQERKASLQTRNLVMEAAARLRTLVKTSSNILFGIPDKQEEMYFNEEMNRRHGNSIKRHLKGRGIGDFSKSYDNSLDGGYNSDSYNSLTRRNIPSRRPRLNRIKDRHLTPSNYRLIQVTDNEAGKVNYDSDPGESYGSTDHKNGSKYGKDLKGTDTILDQGQYMTARFSKTGSGNGYSDTKGNFSGYNLKGILYDHDNNSNWNLILVDNIEVLTEICDTLLIDRKACLEIMKVKPRKCESLVDAVSKFLKNRNIENNNKMDIEKRLRILEKENRTLQEEMGILQKTLADKNRDALNLQTQLDRLESMMNNYTAPKLNKCVGTSDEMFPAVFKNNLTVGSNKTPRLNNNNQLNIPKLTKSPRMVDKENKTKSVNLPSVNGMNSFKQTKQNPNLRCQDPDSTSKEHEMSSNPDNSEQLNLNASDRSPPQSSMMVREPSLIEISEEKLKTLKHRAKTLEDSLHDAITSMEKLNTSTQKNKISITDSNVSASLDSMKSNNKINNRNPAPRTFRSWQKASFEINTNVQSKTDQDVHTVSRVAVIKRSNSFSKQLECKDTIPDVRIALNSEASSLIEGTPAPMAPRDIPSNTPISSSLRPASEKTNGAMLSSRSNYDGYTSDEERSRHDYDGILTYRRQPEHLETIAATQLNQGTKARRLRARHNTSRMVGNKQKVSKCLRCQKIFSPNDNHKLACCYHTKDKERLEHYDQSGMLIRVIYAWKCCHEPQESEGCCFGQHV